MRPTDLIAVFAPRFDASGIEWMIAGGVASIVVMHLETGARADVYLAGKDALARRGLAARRTVQLLGRSVPIAPPEDVILHKLRFVRQGASDRHLRDVRAMLRVLGDSIDRDALVRDVAELGLTAEWAAMEAQRD